MSRANPDRGPHPGADPGADPGAGPGPAADPANALLLAMDTASPTVSVAVGRGGVCLARRAVELRRSSENLLRLVDEALAEAGATLRDLDGVLALRGPGSFTGLRVGLATTLGLHQALGLPATAVPTLDVLAHAAQGAREGAGTAGPKAGPVAGPVAGAVVAVVDALRGEWFSQLFSPTGEPLEGAPEIRSPAELAALEPELVVGFGAGRLAETDGWTGGPTGHGPGALLDLASRDPGTVAAAALSFAAAAPERIEWSPSTLTRPLYLRPPAVTLPKARSGRPGRPAPATGGSAG